MKAKHIPTYVGLVAGAVLSTIATQAQAATFSSFDFVTNKTFINSKSDITLSSVEFDGNVISEFSLVTAVENFTNDPKVLGTVNSGAASSDRGDTASGIAVEDPTPADVVTSLGNLNLNNIIDTEDTGSFSMDVIFDQLVDQFFFWERGRNSKLKVEALSTDGTTVLASFLLGDPTIPEAGYSINTTEIGGAQIVGSKGLQLDTFTNRLRLSSTKGFNGPDFKVVAAASKDVPEPATILGLAAAAGAMATARRRKFA